MVKKETKQNNFSYAPESLFAQQKTTSTVHYYSYFVKMAKLILPTIAAILIGMIIVWPQIVAQKDRFKISFNTPSLEKGGKLKMQNARFFATDKKNQPYSLTADVATEKSGESMIVELVNPKADILLNNGAWVAASADFGVFLQNNDTIELKENVGVFHNHGYSLETKEITVMLKEGTAFSSSPIYINGSFGYLESEGIDIKERGDILTFTGKTKLVLYSMPEKSND